TVLERVYNTTSESAKYGSYLMCGPKCYEVADFVFLGTDFAVDYGIKGEDAATKQLVAHAMSKALLQTSGFSTLMQNRTTHLIGSSGLYSLLNQTVGDPAFQKSVMTILAQSGAYAASRLTGDRMTAATKALGDFVQRSSNFDRSLSTKMSSPPRD